MKLFSSQYQRLLEHSLNAASLRQKTISENIANVDTPNYKAKKTVFKHQLETAIQNQRLQAYRTDERHLEFGGKRSDAAIVVTRNNSQYNHNGNNVDIEHEMSEMAKNQIYYNALIDRLNGRFNSIKTVIGGK